MRCTSSWGNAIEARRRSSAWAPTSCAGSTARNHPTGTSSSASRPAHEVQRRLLTLWNSIKFLADYGQIEDFRPVWGELPQASELKPLDRWLIDRTHALVRDATAAYESFLTVEVIRAFEAFVDDLSNWYIRRSRRRFWDGDRVALHVLWHAVVQSLRVVAPVMPFLTEHLWQQLVREADGAPPPSVHLAGWPDAPDPDETLLAEIADVRRVVGLGHQARQSANARVRQPLRRLVVEGAPLAAAHVDEIRDELRVKEVEFGSVDATELHVKPHLPVLGPKLGKELGAVRAALAAGEFEELPGGGFRAAGRELGPDEVLVERSGKEGWSVASEDGLTVALDTRVDSELELEGRVYDLIHALNSMRKEQGLALTDRITVTLPTEAADLLRHEDWIKAEVLAVSIETDGDATPTIAKV